MKEEYGRVIDREKRMRLKESVNEQSLSLIKLMKVGSKSTLQSVEHNTGIEQSPSKDAL